MKKLQQSKENASATCQESTEDVLKGLAGIIIFHDDVLVFEMNNSQSRKRVQAVSDRLKDQNFTINETGLVQSKHINIFWDTPLQQKAYSQMI